MVILSIVMLKIPVRQMKAALGEELAVLPLVLAVISLGVGSFGRPLLPVNANDLYTVFLLRISYVTETTCNRGRT